MCDGGCDKATIGNVFAEALQREGVKVEYYDKPQVATLADGSKSETIIGRVIADIELITAAGRVVLQKTDIDVLKGPEKDFLLYVGRTEERRLNLRSYAAQLEGVAAKAKSKLVVPPDKPKGRSSPNKTTKVRASAGNQKYQFKSENRPRVKRRLARGGDQERVQAPKIVSDGNVFVGKDGWSSMLEVKYLREPVAQESYVTTAALVSEKMELKALGHKVQVAASDLSPEVQNWMGGEKLRYDKYCTLDLRVLPDENKDLIQRLTILPDTKVRVVESKVPAVVIGQGEIERLRERGQEQLDTVSEQAKNDPGIELRLQEQLDHARLEKMSVKNIRRSEKMIRKKFRNIWRLTLGPKDFADVPAMEIKLKPGVRFSLPKPYMRRYTPAEIKWWRVNLEKLVMGGIFQPSKSSNLSPSNLVKKMLDGKVLTDDFRLVIDLRELNKLIEDLHFPLPKLDEVVHHLKGATCFAKSDETKGYWQFMLAQLARALTGFICPLGAYEHLRVPMGLKTAAAYFQKVMQTILKPLLYQGVIQYLDDSLIYGSSEDELLDRLEQFFTLLDKHNIKLHPGKFVLFSRKLVWGGKEVTPDGIAPPPHRIAAIQDMPEPENLSQMMNFVYGTAWFRGHIPYFAETAAPLYDIWKDSMTRFKRKTALNAQKILLKDVPEWKTVGKPAFEEVKKSLVSAVRTTFYDPELVTCVFADASDKFWCLVITQCEVEDLKKDWSEQVGKHRLLALESGRFRHAQLRWHIVEKEAFSFGVKLNNYAHWINGGRYPSRYFTDHKNLLALFDDKARPLSCTKPNRDRLTRWGVSMLGMRYVIYHIDGEENRLADLGSRWGNRFAKTKSKPQDSSGHKVALTTGLQGGAQPMLNGLLQGCKRALRTPAPVVSKAVNSPDQDLSEFLMLAEENLLVDPEPVVKAQRTYRKTRPSGLTRQQDGAKLWVNKEGQIWIPKRATRLQKQLYALAHQGLAGHRGKDATMAILSRHVFWATMEQDVEIWRSQCLGCLKLATGEMVPRPLGTQLIAERPGEILMADYIKMGKSRTGFEYVLMLVDKFSRLVRFIPCTRATAIKAARGIIAWSAQRGIPDWLISDGGSHFKNSLLKQLAELLGFEHHITLAYCPWANGSVEVVGKDLVWTARAICSDFRCAVDEWDLVLDVIEFAVNHRPREVLGHRSALEVVTGRQPKDALGLAFYRGETLKEHDAFHGKTERVAAHCEKLTASLGLLHEQLANEAERRRRAKARRQAKTPGMRF